MTIIHYDIAAVVITVLSIFVYFRKKEASKLQNKIFLATLFSCLLAGIGAIAGFYTANGRPGLSFVPVVFTSLYMFAHNLTPLLFTAYIMVLIGINKKHEKKFFFIFFAPAILSLLLILTSPFSKLIFYYTSSVYNRGPLMPVLYSVAVLYFLLDFYYIIRYHSIIPNSTEAVFVTFIFSALISVVVQMLFPSMLIELFVQSVVLLFILLTIENNGEIYNGTTHVYNRRTFLLENLKSFEGNLTYQIILLKILNIRYFTKMFGFRFIQEVLQDIASYLCTLAGKDVVYDCENGNFALILYRDMQVKSGDIVDSLYRKFSHEWISHDISLTFEAQICRIMVPRDANSLENLINLIDTNDFKTENRISIIQEEQLRYMQRKAAIETAIEKALRENTLKVYFQPIYDCEKNKITSAEALVRLIDEDLGFVSPDEFIPIAEKNGTITAIGQFVFEEACHIFSREKLKEIGIEFIDVNLSTVQCMHKNLAEIFKNTLEHYGLSSKTINLEITESAAINSQETFQQTMKDLRGMNFSFSLDDYGTGYSNATYIFNMDFSVIKIDKSILWEAEKRESARIILRNTIRMIKEMNLKIVVEGIETKEQKELVVSLGCDYCQGYYFCKPVPKEQFIEFTKKFNFPS